MININSLHGLSSESLLLPICSDGRHSTYSLTEVWRRLVTRLQFPASSIFCLWECGISKQQEANLIKKINSYWTLTQVMEFKLSLDPRLQFMCRAENFRRCTHKALYNDQYALKSNLFLFPEYFSGLFFYHLFCLDAILTEFNFCHL